VSGELPRADVRSERANGLPCPNVHSLPATTPLPGTFVGAGMFARVAQVSVAML
jgi:hypothetical protein